MRPPPGILAPQRLPAVVDLASLPPARSPWGDARRRFRRNRAAVWSLALLGLITLLCVLGPWVWPHAFDSTDWNATGQPPALAGGHWWGTDEAGRDLLVRCLVGGRVSLVVGLLATVCAVLLGVSWGAVAGFVGGRTDNLMMRAVDMMYAIPYLLIAILVVTLLGRHFGLVVLAITTFSWMDMARLVRGQALALRHADFMEAARAIGVSRTQMVWRHVVPNLLGVVVVYATITVPSVILAESVLSFLGLGIQEPMTSWGVLIEEGAKSMEVAPWLLLFPAGLLALTLLALNFVGDGLRDALDPKGDH